MVEVALDHPIAPDPDDPEDSGDAVGYFQNFGVTAATEGEACELVEGAIQDGEIRWEESRVSRDVIHRLSPAILDRAGDWSERGVWYKSGKALFPAD
jgi:hypothetical protein